MTADYFELGDFAVLVDDRVEDDVSLDMSHASERGIDRLRLAKKSRRRNDTALFDARGSGRFRRRRHSRTVAGNNPLSGVIKGAARGCVVANVWRRQRLLSQDKDMWWNTAWLVQSLRRNLADTLSDGRSHRLRRRRWRRRRRSNEQD